MSQDTRPTLPTDAPPSEPARQLAGFRPKLLLHEDHDLCPGCGEPLAIRILLEVIEELGLTQRTLGVVGIGCYTAFTSSMDVDLIQALHGRAPSVATGAKRMRPDAAVFTLQGDGDMVNEGLQEVIQEGRDAAYHGHPILIGDLLAPLGGTAYAARGSVHDAPGVVRTKTFLRRAFETQLEGRGFSFVEILTMCPTGWFVPTADGPGYLDQVLAPVHATGELRHGERLATTAQLLAAARATSP
jgi:2-oxoglutarate ferredoxin oxidoreductase subunit beta